MDSYERRVFHVMLDADLRHPSVEALHGPRPFGPASFERFQARHRSAAARLPVTCRCGYTTPGPFMEMHGCGEVGDDGE